MMGQQSTLVGPFVVEWIKAEWVGFCFECEWAGVFLFIYSNGAFCWALRLEGRESVDDDDDDDVDK